MSISIIVQFAIATLLPVLACAVLMHLRLNTGVAKETKKRLPQRALRQ